MHYRYEMIDYLPWMYLHNFEVQSQRPLPITTYDTLTYPFDIWTWRFLLGFSVFVSFFLVFIQKLWMHASGEQPPNGWLFQGNVTYKCFSFMVGFFHSYILTLILSCNSIFRKCKMFPQFEDFKHDVCNFRPYLLPHCGCGWINSSRSAGKKLLLEIPKAFNYTVDSNGQCPVICLQGYTLVHLSQDQGIAVINTCLRSSYKLFCFCIKKTKAWYLWKHHDPNVLILIPPLRYNDPIDTVEQMHESGLPFYIMDHTVMVWLAATDPREVVKSINSEQGGILLFLWQNFTQLINLIENCLKTLILSCSCIKYMYLTVMVKMGNFNFSKISFQYQAYLMEFDGVVTEENFAKSDY